MRAREREEEDEVLCAMRRKEGAGKNGAAGDGGRRGERNIAGH